MIADKHYCLTEDRKRVVDESSPEAAFLLVAKGSEIDDKTAAKYGILPKAESNDEAPKKETRAVKSAEIKKR